jgi:hypothetical protein
MDCRVKPGNDLGERSRRTTSPMFFGRPRAGPRRNPFRLRSDELRRLSAHPRENRGRAGRQGPDGPTDLDASQHRGMLKSFVRLRSERATTGKPQVRQDTLASRARCVLKSPPRRPRWTNLSGIPPSRVAYPPLRGSRRDIGFGHQILRLGMAEAPVTRGWRAGTSGALTAGRELRRISGAHTRHTRIPPRVM